MSHWVNTQLTISTDRSSRCLRESCTHPGFGANVWLPRLSTCGPETDKSQGTITVVACPRSVFRLPERSKFVRSRIIARSLCVLRALNPTKFFLRSALNTFPWQRLRHGVSLTCNGYCSCCWQASYPILQPVHPEKCKKAGGNVTR